MVKLYNSLTKRKEKFIPIKKDIVKIYTCGPTVYNYAHIGNLKSYLMMDLLIRVLEFFDYKVYNVMNLTDVDDKTILNSKAKESSSPNKVLREYTQFYSQEFLKDLEILKVKIPKVVERVSDVIAEIENLINQLYLKGSAYIAEDGIYFDISKNKNYGQLIKLDMSKLKYNKGNRMVQDEYDKDELQDFALWKFKKENEPSWKIEIGGGLYEGRPGWHIECSALAMKYLGKSFDIHTGGIDLKFPHHENEIAQTECATGCKFVNYWIHNEFLLVNGKKMSKSLNNFFTLRDIVDRGYNPIAFRYFVLSGSYNQQQNFTFENLRSSQNTIKKINDFYHFILNFKAREGEENIKTELEVYKQEFREALEDNLNTPLALSVYFEFENFVNRNIDVLTSEDLNLVKEFLELFNKIFAVLFDYQIPEDVLEFARQRQVFRAQRNFAKADELRDLIDNRGFEIKDNSNVLNGYLILKKNIV